MFKKQSIVYSDATHLVFVVFLVDFAIVDAVWIEIEKESVQPLVIFISAVLLTKAVKLLKILSGTGWDKSIQHCQGVKDRDMKSYLLEWAFAEYTYL